MDDRGDVGMNYSGITPSESGASHTRIEEFVNYERWRLRPDVVNTE